MASLTPQQRDILIKTILGEARGEGERGMEAVAHVIANRANSNRYPGDPAAVALQPKQFSTWNAGEGGNNPQQFRPGTPQYETAAQVIDRVFSGQTTDPTNGALFYHTPAVNPAWSREVNRHGTTQIGNHIFYNGNPVPPRDIPNVVASQLDVQRPTPLPTPVTERRMMGTQDTPTSAMSRAYPTMNATPRLGNGGIFAYSAPDMQPAQITPGLGSLTPDFFSRPAQIDPVGLGPQSLATVQDMYGRPSLTASVPLPKPRPAMGGDPGGGTMGLPIASLPTTRASLPAIPSRATDTAPRPTQAQIRADNGQTSQRMSGDTRGGGVITPVATIPTTRQAAATPAPASNVGRAPTTRAVQSVPVTPSLPIAAAAPVAPIAPAAMTPIQAQRAEQLAMRNAGVSRPVVQPTAAQVEAATGLRLPNMAAQPGNVAKDQSRLTAGVLPAAPVAVASQLAVTPQIQVGAAPRAVTGYPTPVASRPAPLMAQVSAPLPRPVLPIAAQAPAPLRVSVNGANSYSAPAPTYVTTQTGKQAVSGSSYMGSDGYNYRVESDGTITNTKSGSNSGTWYNPDTNKFERR